MLSANSIRSQFAYRLVPAFGVLIFLFSFLVFALIKDKIYKDIKQDLINTAETLIEKEHLRSRILEKNFEISYKEDYTIKTTKNESCKHMSFDVSDDFCMLAYPVIPEQGYFVIVKKNTSYLEKLLDSIGQIIIVLNVLAAISIGIFSFVFSSMLAKPIKALVNKLALMDAEKLTKLDERQYPVEFKILARTINSLISKINGAIKYKKQLFLSLAHEIKTPLAVIKTKNSVTLMKEREPAKYIETLRQINKTVDEMNIMTSSILNIGRSYYDQLENTKKFEIGSFLQEKAKDYALLVKNAGIEFSYDLCAKRLECSGSEVLASHILQNFIQNAVKFTPAGGKISFKTTCQDREYLIEVIDSGAGLDPSIDPFAPFAKSKEKASGLGLGLFLAKNASDAMDAEIGIENNPSGGGVRAFLRLSCC